MARFDSNSVSAAATPGASRKAGDVPKTIRRRYAMEGERVVLFFRDPKGEGGRRTASFRDWGGRLDTRLEDPRILRDMAAIARRRGWKEVLVRGSDLFRREAWIALQREGVAVTGYQLITPDPPVPPPKRPPFERAPGLSSPRVHDAALSAATHFAVIDRIVARYVEDAAPREAILERARARLALGRDRSHAPEDYRSPRQEGIFVRSHLNPSEPAPSGQRLETGGRTRDHQRGPER